MTRNHILSSLAALCIGISGSAFGLEYPADFWVNEEQGWVVQTRQCDDGLCGYLVGFRIEHPHPPDYVAIDDHNPDPAKRNTPLCGLQLIGGFKPSSRADGAWAGGWVYDPDNGKTYSGVIRMVDIDTVTVRGYVAIPLFGRTTTLHRETGVTVRCALPPVE